MIVRSEILSKMMVVVTAKWLEWLEENLGDSDYYCLHAADYRGTGEEWLALVAEHYPASGFNRDGIGHISRYRGPGYTLWSSVRFKEIVDEESGREFSRPYAIIAVDFDDDTLAVQFKLAML